MTAEGAMSCWPCLLKAFLVLVALSQLSEYHKTRSQAHELLVACFPLPWAPQEIQLLLNRQTSYGDLGSLI